MGDSGIFFKTWICPLERSNRTYSCTARYTLSMLLCFSFYLSPFGAARRSRREQKLYSSTSSYSSTFNQPKTVRFAVLSRKSSARMNVSAILVSGSEVSLTQFS